jgi:hypothetical protein
MELLTTNGLPYMYIQLFTDYSYLLSQRCSRHTVSKHETLR